MTRLVDSAIAVKGAVESGIARELAVTLVHAPHFESKVGTQYAGRGCVNSGKVQATSWSYTIPPKASKSSRAALKILLLTHIASHCKKLLNNERHAKIVLLFLKQEILARKIDALERLREE